MNSTQLIEILFHHIQVFEEKSQEVIKKNKKNKEITQLVVYTSKLQQNLQKLKAVEA